MGEVSKIYLIDVTGFFSAGGGNLSGPEQELLAYFSGRENFQGAIFSGARKNIFF